MEAMEDIMEVIQSMLAGGARTSTVSGWFSDHTFAGLRTTSTRVALDIRHQPIAKRDESRIILPKRAVNEISGLPLGHRMLNLQQAFPEERPSVSTIEPLTPTDDQGERPGTREDDGHD